MPAPPSDPLVVQLANQFRTDLAAANAAQAALIAQRWLQVERALEREISLLVEEAQSRFSRYNDRPPEAIFFELDRYRILLARLRLELDRYLGGIEPIVNAAASAEVRRGATNASALIQAVVAEHGGAVRVTLMDLRPAAVENLVSLARAGNPLQELMVRSYGEAADGMIAELVEGLALGRNPRETARRMQEIGLTRAYRHMELVARDQQIRAHRLATQQQYRASRLVESYVRLAAKSDRTCLACLALDGNVQATDELMALHPQDRCTVVPNVRGYPPVRFQTGREWFEGLPADQQRSMMGPGRHEAWQAGRFDFADLATVRENPVWGPSAVVTPVRELLGS